MSGIASDLIVAPALSIRVLEVLPIAFNSNSGPLQVDGQSVPACAGYTAPIKRKWVRLEGGTDEELQETVSQVVDNNVRSQSELGTTLSSESVDEVRSALVAQAHSSITDNTWNTAIAPTPSYRTRCG